MRNINGRINKLEETALIHFSKKSPLFLFQSLDDENVFHGRRRDVVLVTTVADSGHLYLRSEFAELTEHYELVLITYAKDWRSQEDDDGLNVQT